MKADQLYEAIETSHDITCSNCRKVNTVHVCDEFQACESFYTNGWRMTRHNNVYCPDCAKKKLKRK